MMRMVKATRITSTMNTMTIMMAMDRPPPLEGGAAAPLMSKTFGNDRAPDEKSLMNC